MILRDPLALVPPLAGDLDGSLDGLGARVHGQDHVEAEEAGGVLGEAREDVVVEGAGGEGEAAGLLGEGFDEFGVAVALVDG